jgi:hypothetical protein
VHPLAGLARKAIHRFEEPPVFSVCLRSQLVSEAADRFTGALLWGPAGG